MLTTSKLSGKEKESFIISLPTTQMYTQWCLKLSLGVIPSWLHAQFGRLFMCYTFHSWCVLCVQEILQVGGGQPRRRCTHFSSSRAEAFYLFFFCLTHSPSSPLLHQASQSRSPARRYKRSRRCLLSLPHAVVFSLALVVCTEETSEGVRRSYRLHRLSHTAVDIFSRKWPPWTDCYVSGRVNTSWLHTFLPAIIG